MKVAQVTVVRGGKVECFAVQCAPGTTVAELSALLIGAAPSVEVEVFPEAA